MDIKTKRCSACHETKPVECFYKDRSRKDGLNHRCRDCDNARQQTPEAKASRAAYNKSPEGKASRAASAKTPASKAYRATYEKTPAAKAIRVTSRRANPKWGMLAHARKRAERAGIPCTITVDDFEIPSHCPVFGIPLTPGKGKMHDGSPTLDKIIPELGYVPGNVEVISMKANAMKRNASAWELFNFANYYLDRFQDPDLPVPTSSKGKSP